MKKVVTVSLLTLCVVLLCSCQSARKRTEIAPPDKLSPAEFVIKHGNRISANLGELPKLRWNFDKNGLFHADNMSRRSQATRTATIEIDGRWQRMNEGHILLFGAIRTTESGLDRILRKVITDIYDIRWGSTQVSVKFKFTEDPTKYIRIAFISGVRVDSGIKDVDYVEKLMNPYNGIVQYGSSFTWTVWVPAAKEKEAREAIRGVLAKGRLKNLQLHLLGDDLIKKQITTE